MYQYQRPFSKQLSALDSHYFYSNPEKKPIPPPPKIDPVLYQKNYALRYKQAKDKLQEFDYQASPKAESHHSKQCSQSTRMSKFEQVKPMSSYQKYFNFKTQQQRQEPSRKAYQVIIQYNLNQRDKPSSNFTSKINPRSLEKRMPPPNSSFKRKENYCRDCGRLVLISFKGCDYCSPKNRNSGSLHRNDSWQRVVEQTQRESILGLGKMGNSFSQKWNLKSSGNRSLQRLKR